MAFQVVLDGDTPRLVPKWVSRDLSVPDSPVVANGIVYADLDRREHAAAPHRSAISRRFIRSRASRRCRRTGTMTAAERGQHTHAPILYAFDAETGEELYSSKDAIDDWTHLSSITVVDGQRLRHDASVVRLRVRAEEIEKGVGCNFSKIVKLHPTPSLR